MGIGSFQPLSANERVEIPNGVDVNPNYCGSTGGFSSHPKPIQFTPRPRAESNSIDFSQSLTQILTSLGHNLNANPKEGFDAISACTDTWKENMTAWHNKQEERILNLEIQLSVMSYTIQGSQTSLL